MVNNRKEKFSELRSKYPEFIYSGYSISESDSTLDLDFHFVIPGLAEFKPTWKFSKPAFPVNLSDGRLNELAFSLGMVELISYWKLTCSPTVRICGKNISPEQISWWKKLYSKGLGEFFYVNGITIDDDFMSIFPDTSVNIAEISHKSNGFKVDGALPKALIPIGGGKDSAVTIELLKECADRYCFIINPRKATLDTFAVSGISDSRLVTVNRTLDKNMLELNKQGFLNGHTPFSALVAFSAVLAAYLNGIEYVALSNESSANEATVIGSDVNHQYSKSVEFEADFINYERRFISSGVHYFSLLRPLTEIGIAKIFSKFEKYHDVFQSCNLGSKTDIWCGNCPKCLFVYIILAPFLAPYRMVEIFGKDMLNDEKLTETFEQLVGIHPEKPFECVGSCDEVNAALQELLVQYEGKTMPCLLKHYKDLAVAEKRGLAEHCNRFDTNNHVPQCFVDAVKNELN